MIASHRTPAVILMTAGGFLFITSRVLPFIFRPDTPHGVFVGAGILLLLAIPVFIVGACIYARGIGYPAWLGLFSVTVVGLLILLWLPDRNPDANDQDY